MATSHTSMFWREFPTKKSIEDTIRAIVNPRPFKMPFESSLISELVLERHYFCSHRGLRPSRFRKLPGYGVYTFEGDFAGLPTPEPISWHAVSWTKCIIPPLTEWDRIIRAMRDRIEPDKTRYKKSHPICEACHLKPTAEAHHATPTFLSIAATLRGRVSDLEVSKCLAEWNWFCPDNFALPADHKVTIIFDQLHTEATLQALCRECHNKTKRRNPQANVASSETGTSSR
jgi:hypothetical protein